ncbi:hypothetical protein CNMCM6936_001504 [Aspergillus lentulus]|uniref:JmjC domain-containing protein n=2 Tax=Aspergillus lentulus TaxID=293939 RepID=A0AAN5YT78_ASPLE|nr:hypothetical protein CNMCM6069_002061 [Aspergillus lentulus]KAF4168629.1 hypothetical protein CNMCM6936_001504 [Aspergillus lentulus]KAF4173513.1 hypothetical protein CNMCM8060_000091 [Aspergillus lentulus]KAF4188204.1 hypothetical protein CNMCM7927_002301 [Aspergillus lentulus]KAF4195458.1 hypothetical protein CNMCM8694_006384 [Aspergillus lentulus]
MSLISSRDGRSISSTSQNRYRPLRPVRVVEIDDFRSSYFHPELPVLLPRQHFRDLPACERWFQTVPSSNGHDRRLNTAYLQEHGGDSFVPLELTQSPAETKAPGATVPGLNELSFRQFHAPLSLFLDWMRTAELQSQAMRLYLAQCQLLDLPPVLRDDFPTPELVLKAGKGDVYDTNVWIGHPPTYTPLHRDPNPNLFVQIAGRKVVRLLAPDAGQRVFASVRRQLGRSGDREAAAFRGEEMMQGQERTLLEQAVWEDADSDGTNNVQDEGYEAHLEAGDGLFIPKGWWHSIKGVGEGVTASSRGCGLQGHSRILSADPPSLRFTSKTSITAIIIPSPLTLQRESHSHCAEMYTSLKAISRATVLHLSLNPLLSIGVRASTAAAISPNLRSYSALYPICPSYNLYHPTQIISIHNRNQEHPFSTSATMSADSASNENQSQHHRQPGEEQEQDQNKPILALPEAPSADSQATQLDVSGGGSTVKLDALGPLVVNQDGTLSRIANWEQMTEIERRNTLRVLGKRNKLRLDTLKAAEGEKDESK